MKTVYLRASVLLLFLVGSLFAIGVTPANATASLENEGFETGDFTGWTPYVPVGGEASVVAEHTDKLGIEYNPVKGNYFALLKTDGPGSYTSLTQTFHISAGQKIDGWAAFDTIEKNPLWNDDAMVRILDSSSVEVARPWYSSVSIIHDGGDGNWTYWNWTATTSGTYTLEYRVANAVDSAVDSYALFDAELTPKSIKEDAIAELEATEGLTDNRHTLKEVDKALKHINESLDEELWTNATHLDEKHGNHVFDEEKKAADNLMKIVKEKGKHADTAEVVAKAQIAIGKLVEADELLVTTAIEDAKNIPLEDPKKQGKVDREIAKAEEELAKAEEELGKENPDKAIGHYKKAWEHAQHAIEHVQK